MDNTNFVDVVRADFCIDDVDEANEFAHRYGVNTPDDQAYGDILAEECTNQDDIDDAAYKK